MSRFSAAVYSKSYLKLSAEHVDRVVRWNLIVPRRTVPWGQIEKTEVIVNVEWICNEQIVACDTSDPRSWELIRVKKAKRHHWWRDNPITDEEKTSTSHLNQMAQDHLKYYLMSNMRVFDHMIGCIAILCCRKNAVCRREWLIRPMSNFRRRIICPWCSIDPFTRDALGIRIKWLVTD